MVRRLFWVCLPSLLSQVSLASDAAWNCQQDKDSKEWVCVGDKKPVVQADTIKRSNDQPTVKDDDRSIATPVTQPIKQTESIALPPAKIAEPIRHSEPPPVVKTETPITPPSATESINGAASSAAANVVDEKQASPVEAIKVEPPAVTKAVESPSLVAEPIQNIPAESGTEKAGQDKTPTEKTAVADTDTTKTSEAPGWHCGAGGEKEGWDCKLVGAAPTGKPQVVKTEEDEGFSMRLLNPVFSHQEENIFRNLNERFPVDPWAGCGIEMSPQKKKPTDKKVREESPIDMNSNYSEIFDNEVGSYFGDVDIKRADQRASAHAAHYDSVSQILDLHGDVFYSEDEIGLYTDSATLKLASDEARLRDALFISPTTPIRGRAKAVYRDSQLLSRYREAAYTTCRPGNQDWAVHASELKLNKETGKGAAKNAWLEFKGFPVFYSPYLSFPIDDRRLSGFLAPVFGNTRSNGFDISVPFYWNIAPNYDATLRPRYLMERGTLLAGDFRYLTENSHGMFSGEYLPNDGKQAGNVNTNTAGSTSTDNINPYYDKARYQLSFNNTTLFSRQISSNLDLNYVSDKNYFSDLGNSLSFSNFRYIKSFADLKYIDDGIKLTGQVVSYQRVDETVAGPYRQLPHINLALDHAFDGLSTPIYTELDSDFVYFQKDSLNGKNFTEAQRLNIKPSVSLPWKTDSAYVTPKLSVQYTQYLLNNQGENPGSVSRVSPILSVDSGVYLERDLDIAGATLKHTLEPRLFYLYIPRTDQKDIPLFDTSLYDFRYNSMFRENRFSGTDRVQDANQITLALTSRLLDPSTGLEKLKVNVGDILYFQNRDVTLNYFNEKGALTAPKFEKTAFNHQTFSNVITEVSSQFNQHFSADAGLQWNPRTNNIERGSIGLHFVNEPGELINLGFQFRRDDSTCRSSDRAIPSIGKPVTPGCEELRGTPTPEQLADPNDPNNPNNDAVKQDIILSDASMRWPIYDDWYGIGRWQYSWLYGRTQEAFLGFEKENCCWRFRIIGRRYFNGLTNPSAVGISSIDLNKAQAQTGVFFQIELKGLTGIGQKLDDFFERNIYGYQKPQK